MCFQMFNLLCAKAGNRKGGRLRWHVRCLLDEFANIGEIPNFDKLTATIRSREISATIILQTKSKIKSIYKDNTDTIEGNCDTTQFLGAVPLDHGTALKFVRHKLTSVNQMKVDEQKKASQAGYDRISCPRQEQALLEELFDAEYDFVYKYQNGSHWKVRDSFEQTEGYNHFNSCTRDGDGRFWIELEAVPEPLSAFASEQNLCFDLANGEILNANDGFRATGWYLQNQYIDIMDNAGNVFAGWSDYSDLEPAKYQFGDAGQFEVPYLIWTAEHQWVRFLREYDWVTDCDLYYSVRKNKSFEQVLRDKLTARDNGAARVEYYDVLLRYDGENAMFGNHQVFPSMLPGESFREYGVRQTFGYEIEDWNRESEEPYEGIELSCAVSTPVSAPFDCVISDAAGDSAVLSIEDVMYPFDGSEGEKHDTEIEIRGIRLREGCAEDSAVAEGETFAVTTGDSVEFLIRVNNSGPGWDCVDPRLVLN